MNKTNLALGVALVIGILALAGCPSKARAQAPKIERASFQVLKLEGVINGRSVAVLMKKLHAAQKGDRITIQINSPGGQVFPALNLINAIIHSKATITCQITKMAYSAAALISFNCPRLVADPDTFVGMHKAAISLFFHPNRLTVNELRRLADDLEAIDNLLYFGYLQGALTEKEKKTYDNGSDIVISGQEFVKRHKAKKGIK